VGGWEPENPCACERCEFWGGASRPANSARILREGGVTWHPPPPCKGAGATSCAPRAPRSHPQNLQFSDCADFEFLHLGFRTQGVSCRVVDVEMEIDLVIRSRSRIDLPGYLSGTGM